MSRGLTFLAVFALLALVALGAQAQSPTALMPLDGDTESNAFGINNRGEVAGISSAGSVGGAVVWDRKQHKRFCGPFRKAHSDPTALPPLDGEADSSALGINNRGEVAGNVKGEDVSRAVLWDQMGKPTELSPFASDSDSGASDINNKGQVLGISFVPPFEENVRVVVWDRNGTPSLRPRPPIDDACAFISAQEINNRGEAVGVCTAFIDPTRTAVMWKRNGTPTVLPPLGGDTGAGARGINDRGEVAGFSEGSGGATAVVWSPDGTPRALPSIDGLNCFGFAISANGEVVGSCEDDSQTLAVLWDRSGTPIELPPLDDDTEALALDINARGQIVGSSNGSSGRMAVVWR